MDSFGRAWLWRKGAIVPSSWRFCIAHLLPLLLRKVLFFQALRSFSTAPSCSFNCEVQYTAEYVGAPTSLLSSYRNFSISSKNINTINRKVTSRSSRNTFHSLTVKTAQLRKKKASSLSFGNHKFQVLPIVAGTPRNVSHYQRFFFRWSWDWDRRTTTAKYRSSV